MGVLARLRSLWNRSPDEGVVATTGQRPWVEPPSATGSPGAPDAAAEAIVEELDAAIEGGRGAPSRSDMHPHDDIATRDLFVDIASTHSRPVKNFIFELRRGTASKDWIDICQPVMSSIIDGAESLGLRSIADCMMRFRDTLTAAQACERTTLDDEHRDLILSCYEELVEVLPEAFTLGDQDRRREAIIIHSLLRQIPEVGRVTFDRLYAAGLTSLETLFLANGHDLAVTTGIPERLCVNICEKVHQHRNELGESPQTATQDRRRQLAELTEQLRRHHEAFEETTEQTGSWAERAEQKREARRNRQACALRINVLLGELGEIELVEELEKLPFERRIERIEQHLGMRPGPAPVPPRRR